MSDVEIIGEQLLMPQRSLATPSGITGWLIRKNFAKNEKEAQQGLLAALLLIVGLSIGIIWMSIPHQIGGPKPPPKTNWTPPADYHAAR